MILVEGVVALLGPCGECGPRSRLLESRRIVSIHWRSSMSSLASFQAIGECRLSSRPPVTTDSYWSSSRWARLLPQRSDPDRPPDNAVCRANGEEQGGATLGESPPVVNGELSQTGCPAVVASGTSIRRPVVTS